MQKMQFVFSEEAFRVLNQVKEELHEESFSAVLGKALSMYAFLLEHTRKNYKILAVKDSLFSKSIVDIHFD